MRVEKINSGIQRKQNLQNSNSKRCKRKREKSGIHME